MKRSRSLVALATATMAAVAVTSAPASAARYNHLDAIGDVIQNVESAHVPAPQNTAVDITRVLVRHSANRVIIRTHLRDLNESSGMAFYLIEADDRTYSALHLLGDDTPAVGLASRESSRAVVPPAEPRMQLFGGSLSAPMECAGAWEYAKRDRDVARISIPRSCLGDPATVRVGVGVADGFFSPDARWDDGLVDALGLADDLGRTPPLTSGRVVRRG